MDLRQIPGRPNVEPPVASQRSSGGNVSLADAQLIVAREHGVESSFHGAKRGRADSAAQISSETVAHGV